jgi:hypothetical protein
MKQSKRSASAAFPKKTVASPPGKHGDEKSMHPREDARDIRGKANREEIRNATPRVNAPRESRRPVERGK